MNLGAEARTEVEVSIEISVAVGVEAGDLLSHNVVCHRNGHEWMRAKDANKSCAKADAHFTRTSHALRLSFAFFVGTAQRSELSLCHVTIQLVRYGTTIQQLELVKRDNTHWKADMK
jgi:hypothetical protein